MEIEIPSIVERVQSRLERIDIEPALVFTRAGLPADFLERLTDGKARVPWGQPLNLLAEVLGTSVSYLVGLDPDTMAPQELLKEDQESLGVPASDKEALLWAYRQLDFSSKAALLQVVRKMVGLEPEAFLRSPKTQRRFGLASRRAGRACGTQRFGSLSVEDRDAAVARFLKARSSSSGGPHRSNASCRSSSVRRQLEHFRPARTWVI